MGKHRDLRGREGGHGWEGLRAEGWDKVPVVSTELCLYHLQGWQGASACISFFMGWDLGQGANEENENLRVVPASL